jgi:DNA excision repair protein ERCC-2
MAVRFDHKRISLNVNDLIRPHARGNFLSSFPIHKRGMLGQKAHRRLQKQRSRSYGIFRSEYHLRRVFRLQGYEIDLQGRVDGICQFDDALEVEEIKSVLLNGREFRELQISDYPAFTEQLLFYACLLEPDFPNRELKTFLILINLADDRERVFPVPYNGDLVGQLIGERLQELIEQKVVRDRNLQFRKHQIRELDLSLHEKRPQQENMMEQVWECLETGNHLMVAAPTGTGKTIASLFPAVQHAWLNDKKVFFGTSKTTQQQLAAETVKMLIDRGMGVHAVVLRAARKMCANETFFCHEEHCPFAKDYRKRFDESDLCAQLYKQKLLLPERIYELSANEQLCPFEVSLDLAIRADVIIGDYNYIFDPAVHLSRLFAVKDYADWILILDEAHNLPDRGMKWLSPTLERATVRELIWTWEGDRGKYARDLCHALSEIDEALDIVHRDGELLHEGERYYTVRLNPDDWENLFIQYENAYIRYLIHKIRHRKLIPDDPLESFYFLIRHFVQVVKIQEPSFVPYYDAANGGLLRIRCCNPAGYIGERVERFATVTAMSATLEPMDYYQKLAGFPDERTIRLAS